MIFHCFSTRTHTLGILGGIMLCGLGPFYNWKICSLLAFMPGCFSRVWLFATLQNIARQAPLSTGFSGQECRSGLPCHPPGDLPNPGIEQESPLSPVLAGRFLTTSAICSILGPYQTKCPQSLLHQNLSSHFSKDSLGVEDDLTSIEKHHISFFP